MNIQERAPYLPFGMALAWLGLPVFALLFDAVTVLWQKAQGIVWGWKHGQLIWQSWNGTLLMAVVVIFLFNLIITLSLVKLAKQKLMRRHWRYALFLSGVGALTAWVFGAILSGVVGLQLYRSGAWLVCYAATVFLLAIGFLPKQLTRAPAQVVHFYPRNKKS